MTPAEMDEAVKKAREIADDLPYQIRPPVPGSAGARQALLARALLAAVDGMQAAVRDRDLARDGESESHQAGAAWRTERRLMRDEIKTATARAVAAEQRAERAEAAVAALTTGAQRVLTDERARVVEAIAADLLKTAETHEAEDELDPDSECAWIASGVLHTAASHIRNTNWAAPEEESK